jgi:hypothetical protein
MAAKPISDQLRRAIRQCGKSRYQISMETGIPQATLSRFVHGQAGMGWNSIDKLCQCIGVRLTWERPPTKRNNGKPPRRR